MCVCVCVRARACGCVYALKASSFALKACTLFVLSRTHAGAARICWLVCSNTSTSMWRSRCQTHLVATLRALLRCARVTAPVPGQTRAGAVRQGVRVMALPEEDVEGQKGADGAYIRSCMH